MHYKEEEPEDSTQTEITSYHQQVDAFSMELDNLINRFHNEFDLTLETMVGCLECAKTAIAQPMIVDLGSEMLEDGEEEEI
jgi:hypothetical protein